MSAETWLETHHGEPCSNCGMSYEDCTKRILQFARPACCSSCGYTDTHDERPIPDPTASALDVPADSGRRAAEAWDEGRRDTLDQLGWPTTLRSIPNPHREGGDLP